jgi:hypothetical protein
MLLGLLSAAALWQLCKEAYGWRMKVST